MYLVEIHRNLLGGPAFEYVETKEYLELYLDACYKHSLRVRAIYKKNANGHFIRKSFDYDPIERKLKLYK